MAPRLDSDIDLDSDEDRKDKKKSKNRSRSRSRDRKKSKKHKKEKKRRRKRSEGSGADTGGEGGETPTKREASATPPPPSLKLPGIGKYDSEESEGEVDNRKEYKREDDKDMKEREKERDREKRGDRRVRKKRSRTRSRSRGRRSRSREKEGRRDRRETKDRDKGKEEKERGRYKRDEEGDVPDLTEGGSKDVISLSVDETNKLREKLGLKPLNMPNKDAEQEEDDPSLPGTLIPGDHDKTRHLPADHWGEKANSLKLREKLGIRKEKRTIESKLAAVKGIADSDSDDDAEKWIQRQKSKVEAKAEAEKRAKTMSELDDEFGVGEIVQEKLKQDLGKKYTARHLKGLRVEHNTEHFQAGETILTLKDTNILDEKYEDVLVNVNIMDTEHTKKNFQNVKDQAGYRAYDQEVVDELTGEVRKKGMLYQYNEEIDGEKKDSFTLEGGGNFNEEQNKARELAKIRQKLKLGAMETLETPQLRVASDYFNDEEMAAFKKPSKKGKKKKIRKKLLKADDLLQMQNPDSLLPTDFGNAKKKRAARIIDDDEDINDGRLPAAGENYDDLPVVGDLSGVRMDDDDGRAISSRLNKAKKLKRKKGLSSLDEVAADVLSSRSAEMEEGGQYVDDLILDQTQEFCRGLGENMSFEPSGMGETVSEDLLDFEQSLASTREKKRRDEKPNHGRRGGWEEVGEKEDEEMEVEEDNQDVDSRPRNTISSRPTILEDEALAVTGMAAALKMANQMGYLDREEGVESSTFLKEHEAKRFQVEDKTRDYAEDDRKRRGRDRGYGGGPTTSFQEKKGYKPSINIEYKDDAGRALAPKEAFRYLSHKFHGKGSGKIKTEKRHRKNAEDKVMEKMSSLDTPLQTLSKQQTRTKELGTAYLVLSGNKQLSSIKK